MRLLLGLAWHCPDAPLVLADGGLLWRFRWNPPDELPQLAPRELRIFPGCAVSYETICADLETEFGRQANDLVCACCALGEEDICRACRWAVGFHHCEKTDVMRWRRGTLYGVGDVDIQRVFFNLHLKRFGIVERVYYQEPL